MKILQSISAFTLAILLVPLAVGEESIALTEAEWKNLETFEVHSLSKADGAMAQKDYKHAASAYDAFVTEFSSSRMVSYAMVQMGRCLQLSNKRNAAIDTFTSVLDIPQCPASFAAAAQYFKGECHLQNGDEDRAIKEWQALAAHPDWSKQPLAAGALRAVGNNLLKKQQFDQAVTHFRLVAINFRRSNPDQAREVLQQAIAIYLRKMDEGALRSMYVETFTFERDPQKIEGDISTNELYWQRVVENVRRCGSFTENEAALHDRYYAYWAGQMEGKFSESDDFPIALAGFHLEHEHDRKKFVERVDQQFNAHQKGDDYSRVTKWLRLYAADEAKFAEYYRKYDFSKMSNAQIFEVVRVLYEACKGKEPVARRLAAQFNLAKMTDDERNNFAVFLWNRDVDAVRELCLSMNDKSAGQSTLLRCYYDHRDGKNGIPLGEEVAKDPKYTRDATFRKGEFLKWNADYANAIAAYRQSDHIPESVYEIANCYAAQGKIDSAVNELRELEMVKEHAPEAAWRITQIYKAASNTKMARATLRELMKKYPDSWNSCYGHLASKEMGFDSGGGTDAEK